MAGYFVVKQNIFFLNKFLDVIYYLNNNNNNNNNNYCLFMFKFCHNLLPSAFHHFFIPISSRHNYNSRLSSISTFSIPFARTNNYGKSNILFKSAAVRNNIVES